MTHGDAIGLFFFWSVLIGWGFTGVIVVVQQLVIMRQHATIRGLLSDEDDA